MNYTDDHFIDNEEEHMEKIIELTELTHKLHRAQLERDIVKEELDTLNREYEQLINSRIWNLIKVPKKTKSFIRSTGAYLLGKKNRKQLYSRKYKQKKAANTMKPYKMYLYNFGFIDKVIADLENLYSSTTNLYMRQAIAWELVLWHANKYTRTGASQALDYMPTILKGKQDFDRLRRAIIIKSECYDLLEAQKEGKKLIYPLLEKTAHPDLYLAASNLESDIGAKVTWINHALKMYDIQPIGFHESDKPKYNDLKTLGNKIIIKDVPKVTVIIPSYNAGTGIAASIRSMLDQTWSNLEILIVDDCSTDDTLSIIQSFMEKDTRIKLLTTPENSGPYVARNIALKEASGDFVTINDADDWSHAQKIEKQARFLMENKTVIANTSEHARLTEDLKFYRRGTPGMYIFSNMSSLMFRRQQVMDKIGYWDSVRFAADSEFKRRITEAFGEGSVIDLPTGPLSFPRQTSGSLTGNSAFGYNGFLKGVRKEYAEIHKAYHKENDTLYYPYPQKKRPFSVPEPMWPTREKKNAGFRQFDVIIMSDFRFTQSFHETTMEEIKAQKKNGLRVGLIQKSCYRFNLPLKINTKIREMIDGDKVQLIHYGEKVNTELLIVKFPVILDEMESFLPEISASSILVVMDPLKEKKIITSYDVRHFSRNLAQYTGKRGKWYPVDEQARKHLLKEPHLHAIRLSKTNWKGERNEIQEMHTAHLQNWLVGKNIEIEGSGNYEK